ncbi:MAG: DinB family protein [Phycisphaerales bacterium]|nr:DinB family protein [Phycisphaerales bacterium]
MPESDPLQILLSHDRWATAQLLDACGTLTADQFHSRFDIGPGSLHDALTHVVGAMRAWTETLAGREPRPRLETDGQRRTPEQLRALSDEACREFSTEARRRPLGETVTRRPREGKPFDMTRGAVLTHVATHGMHHRAQCLNMLRRLGVQPLPSSSVTEWTWVGETGA